VIYPFSGSLRFSHDELVESDYRHGVGLTSMRQRAEELGGRWLIGERLVISPKTVRKHIS
jgi:signal transduction histidine kinase